MQYPRLLAITVVLLLTAGSTEQLVLSSRSQQPAAGGDQKAILEAAFRDQIRRCRREGTSFFFLSFNSSDPPEEMLSKLSREGTKLKKQSAIKGFRDPQTNQNGVRLRITKIDSNSGSRATALAECGAGSLDINSYRYRLRLTRGIWKITHVRLIGVT